MRPTLSSPGHLPDLRGVDGRQFGPVDVQLAVQYGNGTVAYVGRVEHGGVGLAHVERRVRIGKADHPEEWPTPRAGDELDGLVRQPVGHVPARGSERSQFRRPAAALRDLLVVPAVEHPAGVLEAH